MILLCISCSICPTIYVNKHLSRLTYGRAPAKGSNHVVTRNRRIQDIYFYMAAAVAQSVRTFAPHTEGWVFES